MTTTVNSSFNDLPLELREIVANRLDSEDVYAFSKTSKANQAAAVFCINKHRAVIDEFLSEIIKQHEAIITLISPNSLGISCDSFFVSFYDAKFRAAYKEMVQIINACPSTSIGLLAVIWVSISRKYKADFKIQFQGEWDTDDEDSSDF